MFNFFLHVSKHLLPGSHRMVVAAIMAATTYGSMLEAGRLSSKYPGVIHTKEFLNFCTILILLLAFENHMPF